MPSRNSLIALASGVLCALLYLAIITQTPGALLLVYFAAVPLYLVGLSLGLGAIAIASSIALVCIAGAAPQMSAILFVLLTAVPAIGLTRQALLARDPAHSGGGTPPESAKPGPLEWYPAGHILAGLTIFGLALLLFVALWTANMEGGLEGASHRFLTARVFRPGGDGSVIAQMLENLARYFPAAVVISWTVMVIANATISQRILVRLKHAQRPSPKYREILLPRWISVAILAAALATQVPGMIGVIAWNALIILALPFFLQGLAVAHTLARLKSAGPLLLAAMYIIMAVAGWPAVIVAALGLTESLIGIRARFGAKRRDAED